MVRKTGAVDIKNVRFLNVRESRVSELFKVCILSRESNKLTGIFVRICKKGA
jgi:hypothetical protein